MDLQMVGEDRVALMGNGWMLEAMAEGFWLFIPGELDIGSKTRRLLV